MYHGKQFSNITLVKSCPSWTTLPLKSETPWSVFVTVEKWPSCLGGSFHQSAIFCARSIYSYRFWSPKCFLHRVISINKQCYNLYTNIDHCVCFFVYFFFKYFKDLIQYSFSPVLLIQHTWHTFGKPNSY